MEMTVASVMTTRVLTALPDTPFGELIVTMTENGVSALPVVDRHDCPIGVVSEADVLARLEFHGSQAEPHARATGTPGSRRRGWDAAEVMTSSVRAIYSSEPVNFAARVLARPGVRRLFVIDWDGRLVGVVSRRDLLVVYLGCEQIAAAQGESRAPRCHERGTQYRSGKTGQKNTSGSFTVQTTTQARVDHEIEDQVRDEAPPFLESLVRERTHIGCLVRGPLIEDLPTGV